MTHFGLFLELEEGIDGLVHVSDLSWTKKVKHPSEFVKVGDSLDVQVLELNVEEKKLALGHKQLEENPWDTFESIFTVGSVHKATVVTKNDKGAILELPYGIEGFASTKHITKEDNKQPEVGESLDFKVIEFSKDEKKIILSHAALRETPAAEESKEAVKKKEPAGEKKKSAPKAAEKAKDPSGSTLGDIEALSALKEQMEEGGKKEEKKKAPKKDTEESAE
jgi:small subunit ribosomal protein S1